MPGNLRVFEGWQGEQAGRHVSKRERSEQEGRISGNLRFLEEMRIEQEGANEQEALSVVRDQWSVAGVQQSAVSTDDWPLTTDN